MPEEFLSERDEQILQLTDRYRLATNVAYQKVVFAEQSLNAVSKVTARMCRQGWLRRYPSIPPEDYFTLGPLAVRQLGLPIRRTEPLGPQALPIDYAVMLYATHGQQSRQRLTSDELAKTFQWMPRELSHAPYCLSNGCVLEMIRVDLGGSPQHVAKKAAADCSIRLECPEFRQLIDRQKFQYVVLTTTASKARLIRQSIEALQWNSQIRLHLTMIPRLAFLQLRNQ